MVSCQSSTVSCTSSKVIYNDNCHTDVATVMVVADASFMASVHVNVSVHENVKKKTLSESVSNLLTCAVLVTVAATTLVFVIVMDDVRRQKHHQVARTVHPKTAVRTPAEADTSRA